MKGQEINNGSASGVRANVNRVVAKGEIAEKMRVHGRSARWWDSTLSRRLYRKIITG